MPAASPYAPRAPDGGGGGMTPLPPGSTPALCVSPVH